MRARKRIQFGNKSSLMSMIKLAWENLNPSHDEKVDVDDCTISQYKITSVTFLVILDAED